MFGRLGIVAQTAKRAVSASWVSSQTASVITTINASSLARPFLTANSGALQFKQWSQPADVTSSSRLHCRKFSSMTAAHAVTIDEDGDELVAVDHKAANLKNIKQDGTTRRFYKKVTITPEGDQGQYALRLGGLIVETPSDKPLILPNKAYARAVQLEFENQVEYVYPHTMPLTNLAITAIDRVPRERHFMEENIMGIFHYDATCYRESEEDTPGLAKLQEKYWDPLLRWLQSNYNIEMQVSTQLEATEVPEEHVTIMRNVIQSMDDWSFAVFESTVLLGKSVVIALAFLQNKLNIDQAFKAIRLEENYQLQVCGRVDGMYGTELQEDHAKLRLASNKMALHLTKLRL